MLIEYTCTLGSLCYKVDDETFTSGNLGDLLIGIKKALVQSDYCSFSPKNWWLTVLSGINHTAEYFTK